MAVVMVAVSAIIIWLFGVFVQVTIRWYEDWLVSYDVDLPLITEWLFRQFTHRPEFTLVKGIFLFWWPMLWLLLWCHFRYRKGMSFAVHFLYGFILCWLALLLGLALITFLLTFLAVGMITDVSPIPAADRVVNIALILCLFSTAGLTLWLWFRSRRG